MDLRALNECIDFFKSLKIDEKDITSYDEKANGQLVVEVTYEIEGHKFQTRPLHYKKVELQQEIKSPDQLRQYFGEPVFWLDTEKHHWPHGPGAEIENRVIRDMISDGDTQFEELLKAIANNAKTGFLQRITWEGRSTHYGFNLENNNHWHDIISLINAIIRDKGLNVDKLYYSRLVFKWDEGERVSMSPNFGTRSIIIRLCENIKLIQSRIMTKNAVDILKYKKQIILQGPPGTGKTKLALEVATEICCENQHRLIDRDFITNQLKIGLELKTPVDNQQFVIVEVSDSVKIELTSGKEHTISVASIIGAVNADSSQNVIDESSYRPSIVKYLKGQATMDQVKLIQFHPSYSYEDFVRGITSEVSDGEVEYVATNKILGEFAQTAYNNLIDSKKDTKALSKEKWAEKMLIEYVEYVEEQLTETPKYLIGDTITYIFQVEEEAFRYKGDNWEKQFRGLRMKFHQLLDLFLKGVETRKDIKKIPDLRGLVSQHATYYVKVLQDFKKFLKDKPSYSNESVKIIEKNYVLVIDEINRANLSSVFGELIYALEYRGRPVESIYAIDKDRRLILPPNLFIIGTMNTADRSVGHIDYAIRRRFAFYTVPPNEKIIESLGSPKALMLFKRVRSLFYSAKDDNGNDRRSFLSPEFNADDVMIGHSYFLEKDQKTLDMRYAYEIKPILKEYVKDGILLEGALEELLNWEKQNA